MKRTFTTLMLALVTAICFAQPTDSVYIANIGQKVLVLDSIISDHNTQLNNVTGQIQALDERVDAIKPKLSDFESALSSQQSMLY